MTNDDEDRGANAMGWFMVHIFSGLVLAGVAVAAAKRFDLPIAAIFLAGWIGHALFAEAINSVISD